MCVCVCVCVCVCEHHYIHTITLPHFSALKGPTSGSTDILRENGQHMRVQM